MNQLTDFKFIKDLFRHYQLKPKQYMGQNFLVSEDALNNIVAAGDLKKTDVVVEVGPGLGVLTQQLASHAKQVVAIEKDTTLIDILNFNMQDYKNFVLHNDDVLQFNLSQEVKGKYKVVANIPYYLTSHLFGYFLAQSNRPELMVFLVQKEVGERVTAGPGEMSVLAVSVQLFADAQIMAQVPKDSFWPIPKVDSVVIKITPHKKYPQVTDEKKFFGVVKAGFAAKRKQLHNNLSSAFKLPVDVTQGWLTKNGIDPKTRAQDLSMQNWIDLYLSFPK